MWSFLKEPWTRQTVSELAQGSCVFGDSNNGMISVWCKVQKGSIPVRAKMARALSNISSNGAKVVSYSDFWIRNWISFRIHDLNLFDGIIRLGGIPSSVEGGQWSNVFPWFRFVYVTFFSAFPPPCQIPFWRHWRWYIPAIPALRRWRRAKDSLDYLVKSCLQSKR